MYIYHTESAVHTDNLRRWPTAPALQLIRQPALETSKPCVDSSNRVLTVTNIITRIDFYAESSFCLSQMLW